MSTKTFGLTQGLFAILVGIYTEAQANAAERQTFSGHVPGLAQQAPVVGRCDPASRLNLAIALPLRNPDTLHALLQQLYDPTSPNFRRYLTPAQFAGLFGATEQDVEAVASFATANNLTVKETHSNRLVVDVTGTVADIERAFHVRLRSHRHPTENRTFFAPDTDPSIDLDTPVLEICGLDNAYLPKPRFRAKPLGAGANTPQSGSGPGGSYRGNDFRAAYVPGTPLNGAGQSVGLLQFDGYYANDIATYASQAGIPLPNLVNVPIDGGISSPGSGNGEVCLDIEMVMSMAPGISNIYVYMAPNPSPWVDLLSRMANDNLAKQLSCSWGGGSVNAAAEQIFQQMAAQGQSFFNASGDSDAFTGAVPFPADSTNITQVGATTLSTTGPGGAYVSETVWNWGQVSGKYVGSSGGLSTYYGLPDYQQGIDMSANQGSTTWRNIPDVALTGDNVYVVYNNGSAGAFGGTSCAAPLWAAFSALINQQAAASGKASVGFVNPALYQLGKSPHYGSVFYDTTTGNNFSSSSPAKYAAVPGYDLCTGWGTPQGTNLINALTAALIITNNSSLVAESFIPANGVLEPSETVTVSFSLQNVGAYSSSNLVVTLLSGGGVIAPSTPQNYGSLAAGGGAASRLFTFTADGTCGGTLTATLQLQDGLLDLGPAAFTFPLGKRVAVQPLAQTFDGVTPPALPAGWTTATTGGQALWTTVSGASDTPPNSAFTAGAATVGVNELVSPVFYVTNSTAQLTFRHNYNLQTATSTGRDGGVLEISIGGGAFSDILTSGGSFVTGGYVKSISSSRSNPLGGRQAWTGSSGGFITTVVNLPPSAAGKTAQLKWRCGTDNGTSSAGWYIDSITIADGSYYACTAANTDLAVSQTATPATVAVSSNLVFTLTVTNLSNVGASSVMLTNSLPATVAFVSASPGSSFSSGQVVCRAGFMPGGSTTNFTITVTPIQPGPLTNAVTLSSTTADLNLANNTSTLAVNALALPQLTLFSTNLAFGFVPVGQSATQVVPVANTGDLPLNGTLNTLVPFGVTNTAFNLLAHQTGFVAVVFSPGTTQFQSGLLIFTSNGGSATNTLSGTGAAFPVALFLATPLAGQAPLLVSFNDTSTGTITNRLWDFGDGYRSNTTATAVSHLYSVGTNTVSLTVTGPVGSSTNTFPALIVATNNPVYADLAITASSPTSPIMGGTAFSIWLSVTNSGPQATAGVLVSNNLPAGASLLGVTASQGAWTNYGPLVVFDLGLLTNSGTASLSVTCSVNPTSTMTLAANSATVTGLELDPAAANNYVETVTTVWRDSVGDHIPDWWRAHYFAVPDSTNANSCATCDPDGDGMNNLAEFIADTDPTNQTSVLKFTSVTPLVAGIRIDWQGGSAARQIVQGRFDLLSSNDHWVGLLTNDPPTPTIGALTNSWDTNQLRFFRLQAVRP